MLVAIRFCTLSFIIFIPGPNAKQNTKLQSLSNAKQNIPEQNAKQNTKLIAHKCKVKYSRTKCKTSITLKCKAKYSRTKCKTSITLKCKVKYSRTKCKAKSLSNAKQNTKLARKHLRKDTAY